MRNLYLIWGLFLSLFFRAQTILNTSDNANKTIKDPVAVILTNGFHTSSANGSTFVASIGDSQDETKNSVNSNVGSNNPSGTIGGKNFHDTQGSIDVGVSGQLQFTLPIAIPPGIKSVAPQINLMYTSGSSNGIAGYGFNLSGITAISRIGKNIEKDGETKGIQLDYSDYYSFNGQRLILKSGEYGKDGAEYVTEKFSNVKIKSVGTITGQIWKGPEYWEVTFEDGSQAWYGGITSGVSNARTPIEYNIVKWKDAQGNYITYNYSQQNNVSLISSIEWGGNEVLKKSHFNQIVFNYTQRSLIESSYVNGIQFIQNKILTSIQVNSNNSQFKKYVIHYDNNSNGLKYQFVKNITEYNANNEPANPITFEYEKFKKEAGIMYNDSRFDDILGNDVFTSDFNGDGRIDFIRGNRIILNSFDNNREYINVNYKGKILAVGTGIKDEIILNKQVLITGEVIEDFLSIYTYSLEGSVLTLIKTNNIDLSKFDLGRKIVSDNWWEDFFYSDEISKVIEGDFKGNGLSNLYLEISRKEFYQYTDIDPNLDYREERIIAKKQFYVDLQNNIIKEISFTSEFSGDFEGDGKTDLFNISNGSVKVYLYNDNIDDFDKIELKTNISQTGLLKGDFNGDGKIDFITPLKEGASDWRMYISTGKSFREYYYSNLFLYEPSWQGAPRKRRNKQRTYALPDLNRDGKSDFIVFESQRWFRDGALDWNNPDSSYGFNYFRNDGVDYEGKPIFSLINKLEPKELDMNVEDINFSMYGEHYIPIFGNFRIAQLNTDFIVLHKTKLITWNLGAEIAEISKIRSITQGGLQTEVEYKELDPTKNPDFYSFIKKEQFPYMEMDKLSNSFVVAQLRQEVSHNQIRKQDFRYRGLVTHLQGKGMIGFRQTARSSWYAEGFENTKIWSGAEIDPLNEGLPIKEWSIKTNNETEIFPSNLSLNNNQLLSFKETEYKIDNLNGNKVKAIIPTRITTKDFIKNVVSVDNVEYNEYYLPVKTISNTNNGFAEKITTLTYYPPNLTGQGRDYFVGRPRSKEELVRAYGDSKGAKEEYEYENHLLKNKISWNQNNTGWIKESYTYDSFGNIIKKIISNSVDSQTQTAKTEYDKIGKFVIKKTDNLGLSTLIEYNSWGQIIKETDPFGNVLTNTYDAWGKLLTSKTNLEGTTSYTYEKLSDGGAKVTEYSPIGNQTITYTNKIGQSYKSTSKAFNEGKFVSKETQYDALGRKIAESEPFFENERANQWNRIEYDEFSRPIKATAFTGKIVETQYKGNEVKVIETNANNRFKKQIFDALGNIASTEDLGGTIVFKYNANGQNIEARYGNNVVTNKYDVWGRKIEFHDPSNGIYRYQYNGFGTLIKEISPKGYKEYTYNQQGQLISQREITTDGTQNTDKSISYTYNNKGLIVSKKGSSKGKPFGIHITYDNYGRPTSTSEHSYGKYYMQKGIIYDDTNRVASYEKGLYSSGVYTSVKIRNNYSQWDGSLQSIEDQNTGDLLWRTNSTNAKGQISNAYLGGTTIVNEYDNNGFLENINHSTSAKTILQIHYRFDAIKNELLTRNTGGDFTISESFTYDNLNRLVEWTNPKTGTFHRNIYDKQGRITDNDQLGKVTFGNTGKIYQPSGIELNAQGQQNVTNNFIQHIAYNENNDPIFIDGEKGYVRFEYGLSEMRQMVTFGGNISDQNNGQGKYTRYYSEDGSYEITVDNRTGEEKHILYIGGNPYESNVIFVKDYKETKGSFKFLHKDYLGSILAITDRIGNKVEQRHYDAWGNLTHLQIGNGEIITDKERIANSDLLIARGYTSHEHLFEVGIIHMNGRLYDPLLRRFLNADENIQDPHNTQNYNKYGYVLNNPLMYNDPSGEFIWWVPLVTAIITHVGHSYYMNQPISFEGIVSSVVMTYITSGVSFGVGEIFSISSQAGKLTQIGTFLQKNIGEVGLAIVQAGTHAVSQGVLSVMQGGSFEQAFWSGALGSLGASAFGAVAGDFGKSTVGTVAFGALSGGIGSELFGGNFWEGAVIGGIVAGLNHAMHNIDKEKSLKNYLQNKKNIEEKITELLASRKLRIGKKYTDKELKDLFPKESMAKYIKSINVKGNNNFYIEWTGAAKLMSRVAYIRLEDGNLTLTSTRINNANGYKLSGGALYIKDGNNIYKNIFIKGKNAWGILPNNNLTNYIYTE